MTQQTSLMDRFGRHVDYVRISVTDRCDLRCIYCMSEDIRFVPRSQLLTLEEIVRIGRAFVALGVTKIRITGGEPLTRKNVVKVFDQLGRVSGLKELTLTTNGTQLPRYAGALRDAGVKRINISIDSLQPDRFHAITRNGDIDKTLAGIDAAIAAGFERIKLNAVILKNRNHDEVLDLVGFAIEKRLDISFIEEMPLGIIGDHDRAEAYYSSDRILSDLREHYEIVPTTETTGTLPLLPHRRAADPGRFHIAPQPQLLRPVQPGAADRRRTAAALSGARHSVDLRRVVRANPTDDRPLRDAIVAAMQLKPKGHDFNLEAQPVIFRHMNTTGG